MKITLFFNFVDAKHMTIAKIYTAKLIWENYKTMKKAAEIGRRKSVFQPKVILIQIFMHLLTHSAISIIIRFTPIIISCIYS